MAIYEVVDKKEMCKLTPTEFAKQGVTEPQHLRPMLAKNLDEISPNQRLLLIAEEYSFANQFESKKRVDLLCIDVDANLVVIEIKRTDNDPQVELQAIRYAAMADHMTFEHVIDAYEKHFGNTGCAQKIILDFLGWPEPDELKFAQEVRIILVAAEFDTEITNTVLWLNDMGLDITCITIKPYEYLDNILIDIQQKIPLPEAVDYMVKARDKSQKERTSQRMKGIKPTYYQLGETPEKPVNTWADIYREVIKHAAENQFEFSKCPSVKVTATQDECRAAYEIPVPGGDARRFVDLHGNAERIRKNIGDILRSMNKHAGYLRINVASGEDLALP